MNLEVQISWQVQHLVNLEAQISWQAQRMVNLEVQAQHLVNLEVPAQYFVLSDAHSLTPILTLPLSLTLTLPHTP